MKILMLISFVVVPLFIGMLGLIVVGLFNTIAALTIIGLSLLRRLVFRPRGVEPPKAQGQRAA